jgi:transposase
MRRGLLWVMRTGAPWREIPAAYGSWHTLYSRYRRWDEDGHNAFNAEGWICLRHVQR